MGRNRSAGQSQDHALGVGHDRFQPPRLALEEFSAQRAVGVDQPHFRHGGQLVGAQLGIPVIGRRAGGKNLDHQIGCAKHAPFFDEAASLAGDEQDVRLKDLALGQYHWGA
jgi:hypothetical protein